MLASTPSHKPTAKLCLKWQACLIAITSLCPLFRSYKESIQRAELLDTMPRDNFTKTNGGATETYAVGHFKGNTYGKCMLFIYKGNAPYILIQTDTQTMFFNAKDSSMTKQWYEQLCE